MIQTGDSRKKAETPPIIGGYGNSGLRIARNFPVN
jgi:hypothetical protein